MKPGLLQRAIWTYVAACAAWRFYPKPTTVLPNEEIEALLGGCMIEEESGFCDLHESYTCRSAKIGKCDIRGKQLEYEG